MPSPEIRYTTVTGPGDSTSQPIPTNSLGGFAATNVWSGFVVGDLFGRASSLDVANARASYRGLFVLNPDGTDPLQDVRVYVAPVTPTGGGLSVGVDPRPATYPDSLSPSLVEVTSPYAAPAGVTFSAPADYATGVQLGDLPAAAGRGVWVKLVPYGTGGSVADACDVTVAWTGGQVTKRVLWTVEGSVFPDATRPPASPKVVSAFTPTPTPFRRLAVDFLAANGSRVAWDLDPALRDDGPYVFRLYTSRYGTPDAPDWAVVGPPVQDAQYLVDPTARLWGAAKDTYYRVTLTTATTTYTSQSAGSFGRLDAAGWLIAREVLRKEQLVLRGLAGIDGYLFKARRFGARCSCVDPYTGEVANSADPVCYGTGFAGGFLPPVALSFALPATRTKKERVAYNEGAGTVLPDGMKVRMVASTPVASRDVWVSRGPGERWYVHEVAEVAAWQGVPLVYEVTLKLAPRGDVIYTLPVTRPVEPTPYWRQGVTITL